MESGDAWPVISQQQQKILEDTLKLILMDCLTSATSATRNSGQITVYMITKEDFIKFQINKSSLFQDQKWPGYSHVSEPFQEII